MVRTTAGMSAGRRNLLERLARSRAAADLRELSWHVLTGLALMFMAVGAWVVTEWLIDVGAPALARWLGWI